jgi:hypothetical protein
MHLLPSRIGPLGVALLGGVLGGCAGAGASGQMVTIHPGDRALPPGARGLILGLKPCYRAALRGQPQLEGELTLTAELGENGGLKSFTLDTELPRPLQACLRDHIARWRLPPAPSVRRLGPLRVSFRPVADSGGGDVTVAPAPRRRPAFIDMLVWPEDMPRATRAGDATVGGRIRKVLRDRVANLRYCYNRELIRAPGYRAAARISFTINPYGQPYLVRVRPARPGSLNQAMISCLKQKVVEWYFFRVPVDIRYGPFVVRFSRRLEPRPAPR